jgi:DNA-binding XRE family transcriptional regulator
VPFVDWFEKLPDHAKDKVLVRIERLQDLGHELRWPEADFLRDGIRELRATSRGTWQSAGNASLKPIHPGIYLRTAMAENRAGTTDAVGILHRRFYEGKPERLATLEETRANEAIARKIHALRTRAGLTQAQLAKVVGTTASVICRLEDADYEGHSVSMLRRIAAALNNRVEIRFVPIRKSA